MGNADSSPHINVKYLCVQPADREGESDGPKNERNEKELETEMLYPIGDGGWNASCICTDCIWPMFLFVCVFPYSLAKEINISIKERDINTFC